MWKILGLTRPVNNETLFASVIGLVASKDRPSNPMVLTSTKKQESLSVGPDPCIIDLYIPAPWDLNFHDPYLQLWRQGYILILFLVP